MTQPVTRSGSITFVKPEDMVHNAPRPVSRQSQPGEFVYGLRRGCELLTCELRDRGELGVELQFIRDGQFLAGHCFENRAAATYWAALTLDEHLREGWTEAA